MKKRFKSWFKHLFIRYIPSIQMIVESEARRLIFYITENYSREDQKYLIDELSKNLIEFRKQEIEYKVLELERNEAELVELNKSLEKLLVK